MTPRRIQLRRTKGWRKPPGCVVVARPGPYGNPFPWQGSWITWTAVALGYRANEAGRKAAAVALHRAWLTGEPVVLGPDAGRRVGSGSLEFSDGTVVSVSKHAISFALWASWREQPPVPERPDLAPLRGRDLGCWCGPDDVCHADVLLELSNPRHVRADEGAR